MGVTQAFIDLLKPTVPDLWGGLLGQNPRTVQDPLTVELAGQVYSRPEAYDTQTGTFSDLLFPAIPKGAVVAGLGLFDAEVNGEMRFGYVFDAPLVYSKGGYLHIPGSSLSLGLGTAQAAPTPPQTPSGYWDPGPGAFSVTGATVDPGPMSLSICIHDNPYSTSYYPVVNVVGEGGGYVGDFYPSAGQENKCLPWEVPAGALPDYINFTYAGVGTLLARYYFRGGINGEKVV